MKYQSLWWGVGGILMALSLTVIAEETPSFIDIKAKYQAFAEYTKGLESQSLKWTGTVLESNPRVFGGQYLIIDMDNDNKEDLHLLFGDDRETEIKAYQHGDKVEFESKLPSMSAAAFDSLLIKLDNPTIKKVSEGKPVEVNATVKPKEIEFALDEGKAEEKPQIAEVDKKKQAEVIAYFTSSKEPKVKDAVWTSDRMFKVGVLDDGSIRDGLAEYVCLVLKQDFKISGVSVKVIDIEKLLKEDKWIDLGKASCK